MREHRYRDSWGIWNRGRLERMKPSHQFRLGASSLWLPTLRADQIVISHATWTFCHLLTLVPC